VSLSAHLIYFMAADGVPPASDFQFDSTMFWEPIGLARKLAHRTLKCVHLPEKAANQLPFAGTQSNCHWVVESNSIETTELHLASTVRRHITYTPLGAGLARQHMCPGKNIHIIGKTKAKWQKRATHKSQKLHILPDSREQRAENRVRWHQKTRS